MIDFDTFCTVGDGNEYSIKQLETVSLQPYRLPGKTTNNKNSRTLTAVRSVEPSVPDFHKKSINVRFFPCLLENSSYSFLTENILQSHGFYQQFIFKLDMVNFNV